MAIKGKSWRSLDLTHNQGIIINSNASNTSNTVLNSLTPRNYFKNRRSSSEPVHEQIITSNNNIVVVVNNEDAIKNNDLIDCLQTITTIEVRNIKNKYYLSLIIICFNFLPQVFETFSFDLFEFHPNTLFTFHFTFLH